MFGYVLFLESLERCCIYFFGSCEEFVVEFVVFESGPVF